MIKDDYFECECLNKEHTLCVTSESADGDFPPQFYIHTQLNQYRNIYKRCISALKFIMGYRCMYTHWDTTNISQDDSEKLIILLHQHRVKTLKHKKLHEQKTKNY